MEKMKGDEKEREEMKSRKGKKWREKLVKERNVISKNKNKKTYLNWKSEESKNLKRAKKVSKEQIVKNKQK